MQRRRQTKRLVNWQNMSFARAMQNFVEFKFAFDKQQKKNIQNKGLGEHGLSDSRWMNLSNFYIRRKNWIES